jgi:hypothetical protein
MRKQQNTTDFKVGGFMLGSRPLAGYGNNRISPWRRRFQCAEVNFKDF